MSITKLEQAYANLIEGLIPVKVLEFGRLRFGCYAFAWKVQPIGVRVDFSEIQPLVASKAFMYRMVVVRQQADAIVVYLRDKSARGLTDPAVGGYTFQLGFLRNPQAIMQQGMMFWNSRF